jgi:hypothetical protein
MPKLRRGLSLKRKPGSGRRSKLSAKDKRRIIQLARKDDYCTSQNTVNEIVIRASLKVSSNVIRRTLNRAGYFKYVPKSAPTLTRNMKTNASNRPEYISIQTGARVFSDESKFQLYRCGVHRWGKKRPPSGHPKYSLYVIVLARSVCGKNRGSLSSKAPLTTPNIARS